MRCIEIYLKGAVYDNGRRLTLTWDVLKYNKLQFRRVFKSRLTLTWDVLKYGKHQIKGKLGVKININMRCIEIVKQ